MRLNPIKLCVYLAGFDGQLSSIINSGSAEIHLSRITASSDITIKDSGNLNLKVADSCLDTSLFRLTTTNLTLAESLKSANVTKEGDVVVIHPVGRGENVVLVNCAKSNVVFETASWQEMIEAKLKNKT